MTNPLQTLFPATVERRSNLAWPNDFADRGYVLFFTGRCGSTELVDILRQTRICGEPDEYFNEEYVPHNNPDWKCDNLSDYIQNLIETRSAGRTFGFKVDGYRHRKLCEIVDPLSYFPKSAFKFILMNRRNLLEQAYSYAHAKKTGVWHSNFQEALAPGQSSVGVEISDGNIWCELALILEQEFYFERYIVENSLDVLRIDYEMFCASKIMLVTDVMLTIGCDVADVFECIGNLSGNFRKLQYDVQKSRKMINFRQAYASQLNYLGVHRGKMPYTSLRHYIQVNTGVDVADS